MNLQLEKAMVSQSRSLIDLHYQQVLENIARTLNNPAALPSFAVPISGSAQITDTFSLGANGLVNAVTSSTNLSPTGTVNIQAMWNLVPVTEPSKLQLMRVAHQVAISHPVITDTEGLQKLHRFLGAEPHAVIPQGWWSRGSRWDVPRSAAYSAHYGNTYVWVMPEGVPGLSRFTLHMLDLATAASTAMGELVSDGPVSPSAPLPPGPIVPPAPARVSDPAPIPATMVPPGPTIPPPPASAFPKPMAADPCLPAPLPAGRAEIMPATKPRAPVPPVPLGILPVPPRS